MAQADRWNFLFVIGPEHEINFYTYILDMYYMFDVVGDDPSQGHTAVISKCSASLVGDVEKEE